MDRRVALGPLLALAGMSLSGCVAVAIPALAGSAMAGTRVDGQGAATRAPAAAPVVKPVPTVTVMTASAAPTAAPATAPVSASVSAAGAAAVSAAVAPAIVPPAAADPDPDSANPLTSGQLGFARFVRYAQASALGAKRGADLLSAMLSDPVALDGQRRRCAADEQMVALIDLDPKGGSFAPPVKPASQPGLALGLAVMREAGAVIAWLSDISVNQSGALRTALEQSGLDPRGEDIISLRRDGDDSKQKRKDNLAGITCIVAIAGDERADFDERFKYLRNPEAGAGLEPVIGDGWFLIQPVFPTQGQ